MASGDIRDVQQATHNASTNTLALPAFAANPTTGDTIIVAYSTWTTTSNQLAPTDSAGNTYTQIGTEVTHGQPEIISLWYAHNITGGSSFVVTGHVTTNQHHTAIAWLIEGDWTYNGDFTNNGGATGSNPLSTGTSSPAPSGVALFIGAMSYDTSTAATDGSGWNDTSSHAFTATLQGRARLTSFTTIDLYTEYKYATGSALAADWGITGTGHRYNALVASFSATSLTSIDVPAGSVVLTGLAPMASTPLSSSLSAGSVVYTGLVLTMDTPLLFSLPAGSVVLTGLVPSISPAVSIAVPVGSVVYTGLTPGIGSRVLTSSTIVFRQAVSANAASGSSSVTTPAFTSGNGNLLVVQVADAVRAITGTPVTDNMGNVFLLSWVRGLSGSATPTALYYVKNMVGGTGHTVTFTPQGGTDACAIAVAEFSGVSTTAPLVQVSTAASAAAPHLSGPITTTSPATQLLIGSGSDGNQQTIPPASYPGLFVDAVALADGTPEGVILSYAIVDAVGQYRYEYTYENGASDSESSGLATFRGTTIAYVQSSSNQSAAAVSLTTPAMATTSGRCLVAIVTSFTRTFSGSPVVDSLGNTWVNAWTTGKAACYYALNIIGGTVHTVTVTPPGGSSACAIAVSEFSGIQTSGALDQTVTATTTTEPRTTGLTAPTAQAIELLVGGGSVSHITNIPYATINGDWTDVAALRHVISGSVQGIILSYQIIDEAGTYEYGFSNGVTLAENVGIATFQSLVPTIPDDGGVPDAIEPPDDNSVCGAEVPLFYCEIQTADGLKSYSWIDQPINEPTIQREPRIVAISRLRRELSDWNGRMVINGGTITVTDYDGTIRAMARTLIRKQIDFYFLDAALLPDVGTGHAPVPYRCGQYLITAYRLGADMTVDLTFEDRFGGNSLRDLLTKPLPFRVLDTSFNLTLPSALNGKAEPIAYGVLSDEDLGFPTVQVWYTGEYTMSDASVWYEGLIAGCATSGPISVWGSDGSLTFPEGQPRQVRMDPSYFDTDIAMPGQGAVWTGYFGSTVYRVKNGRRYTIMYFRQDSDIGEAFKLFGTTNGAEGVPVHVNMGGIEEIGNGEGGVITSLYEQWQHLVTNFVEKNHSTDSNWYAIPDTANTVPYSVIDTASVQETKTRSEARKNGGYLGSFVIAHDLERLPLAEWMQRICLGGDVDMGIDRHGRMFLSMEDATATPVRDFSIVSVLQDTYQPPEKDEGKLANVITVKTLKNLFQMNDSVTLRPSAESVSARPEWLTFSEQADDGASIIALGGNPVGVREFHYEDWVTRDFSRLTQASVQSYRLARSKDGPDFHALETDLCGLDVELGDVFTITHYAGLVPTQRRVRCTAIEVEPPDPYRKTWAVRLFGYDVTVLRTPEVTSYVLTVTSGTGDGTYEAGEVITITANAPVGDDVFYLWTGGSGIANRAIASTTITMPAADTTVVATYIEDATLFTLTVVDGSGDGNYASAAVVAIVANAAPTDYDFYAWTGDVAYVADTSLASTTVTMPSSSVLVTATYAWTGIELSWDEGDPDDAILGYLISWGTTSGVYTSSLDVGLVTTYDLTGLAAVTYYLVVQAYNAAGYSAYSDEVSGMPTLHIP